MAMTWLLVVLDAGLLYVSFAAQYKFVFTEKGQRVPSAIEAAMLDAGMIILSALGIGLAMRGKASKAERFLIVVCSLASAAMNYAAADTASWRSVVAYVAAPVFLAVITDRVISVIRRHVLPDGRRVRVGPGRAVRPRVRQAGRAGGAVPAAAHPGARARRAKGLSAARVLGRGAPVPGLVSTFGVTAEPAEPELMHDAGDSRRRLLPVPRRHHAAPDA